MIVTLLITAAVMGLAVLGTTLQAQRDADF